MHRHYARLGPTQVAILVADYEAGSSIQQLAAKYDCRHETVARWLKVNGVERYPVKTTGIPKDRLAEAQTLRAQGWSYHRIARHYGCSDNVARKAILRYSAES